VSKAADLYPLLRILIPEHVLAESDYLSRYCEKKVMQFGRRKVTKWQGAKHKEELHHLLTGTILLRRQKSEVLSQLPSKRRQRITLDSTRLRQQIMKELSQFAPAIERMDGNDNWTQTKEIMECFRLTAQAKIEAVGDYIEYLLGQVFVGDNFLIMPQEVPVRKRSSWFVRVGCRASLFRELLFGSSFPVIFHQQ
jgi:hypothetical protein